MRLSVIGRDLGNEGGRGIFLDVPPSAKKGSQGTHHAAHDNDSLPSAVPVTASTAQQQDHQDHQEDCSHDRYLSLNFEHLTVPCTSTGPGSYGGRKGSEERTAHL